MKKFFAVAVLALAGIFALTSQPLAQEAKKMGYLNLSKLFDSYEKTKEYQKQLDSLRGTYEKELKERQDKITQAEGRLAALKEEEKATAMKDLEAMRNAMMEFVQAKRTDLAKQEEEKTREILLEMEKVISDYAKKEGFDLIINDRVLLYSNPSMEITDPIIKIMNENYNKK